MKRPAGPGAWLLTASQARRFDALATSRFGVPSLLLMEHAAMGGVRVAKAMLHARSDARRANPRARANRTGPASRPSLAHTHAIVVLVAGPGNNGGDALAMARLLRGEGFKRNQIRVIALREQFKGDAFAQRVMLQAYGVRVDAWEGASLARRAAMMKHMSRATLLVDGLFGTGLDRPIAGDALALVRAINLAREAAGGPMVLSLDLPSGMHADRGVPKGWADAIVRADVTATFAGFKPGLLARGADAWCGVVVPVALGVPEALYRLVGAKRASRRPRWFV
jgi:NAD(P)H-hydrate epimerase